MPGWADAQTVVVEPLPGGITNENHVVRVDGERFVVRIGGRSAELLGIDRTREWAAVRVAARLGIGPEAIFALPEAGVLVSRFVEGTVLTPTDLARPDVLARVAATLRRVHASPPIAGAFSPFRTVEAYRTIARQHGVPLPAELDGWLALGRRMEATLEPAAPVLCHNDLLPANLIEDGRGIRILDWEYAAMGDRFFDLANLAANAELGPAEETRLLATYFAGDPWGVPADAPGRLARMRVASDLREATWGLVQVGISRLSFDFAGYAARHFTRVAARAAELRL